MASALDISPETKALVCELCWRDVFTLKGFKDLLVSEVSSKKLTYVTSAESIAASTANGCSWCTFLTENAKNSKGDVEVTLEIKPEERTVTPAGAKRLFVSISSVKRSTYKSYTLYTTKGDNASVIITPKDRVLDVSADSSYNMALERLALCIETHEHCPKPNEENTLPDRVVDCTNPQNPKVVVTHGQMKGAYAAFSYVWGLNAQHTYGTDTNTLESRMKDGFILDNLPQTLQDAIISTKKFGLRYLWVDALCILQDSKSDQIQQMGKMNTVYRGAYVAIIAASSDHVTKGFLKDRLSRVPAARIPFVCPDGKVGSVCLANSDWDYYDARHAYYDVIEPVNGRGWCMQERFLSERAFIFASDTLRYYCQKETASIGDALCEPSTSMTLPRSIFLPNYKLSEEDLVEARQAWLYVIWDYTRRGLGHGGKDKLNAIGGIAEQFGSVWKSKYLAGIWEYNLLEDLLWERSTASDPVARSEFYRAPSWSWASIDGIVNATSQTHTLKIGQPGVLQCDIVECEVTLLSPEAPFAAVTAGHLKLIGRLYKVTTKIPTSPNSTWPLFLSSEEDTIGWVKLDALDDIKESDSLFVVPILWNAALSSLEALVLSTADNGNYRRVGIFSASDKHSLVWVGTVGEEEVTIF